MENPIFVALDFMRIMNQFLMEVELLPDIGRRLRKQKLKDGLGIQQLQEKKSTDYYQLSIEN